MSDDDLIRRGDVRELLQQCGLMGNHPNDPLTTMFNEIPAADARAKALLKRAAQMAYEVWDDPEALSKAILALITETKP